MFCKIHCIDIDEGFLRKLLKEQKEIIKKKYSKIQKIENRMDFLSKFDRIIKRVPCDRNPQLGQSPTTL